MGFAWLFVVCCLVVRFADILNFLVMAGPQVIIRFRKWPVRDSTSSPHTLRTGLEVGMLRRLGRVPFGRLSRLRRRTRLSASAAVPSGAVQRAADKKFEVERDSESRSVQGSTSPGWSVEAPTPLSQLAGKRFRLSDDFIAQYRSRKAPFGFNGLGELVYHRTYSRARPDGTSEQWHDTVQRVIEGTYNMQKGWYASENLAWDEPSKMAEAERMFDRIFEFKFLPPGRGLWAMGSALTEERGIYAALNNCAFVSTDVNANGDTPVSQPFKFLMDASMLGVGVGFDTKGAENGLRARAPDGKANGSQTIRVADTREGWVEALGSLIDSYFEPNAAAVSFDYSAIRKKGEPIRGFGGVASGSGVLEDLIESVRGILQGLSDRKQELNITAIVDIMNLIGRCVIAGNVRRTAEIAFGPPASEEYLNLKNYSANPHRMDYGWASNNSIYAELGMDYKAVCERIRDNGEPGFAWLDNMRDYGRMVDPPDYKDAKAMGGNPCLEQTLESMELCCLVETFPENHDSVEDFMETLELAYAYAKTVTLGPTHWTGSNSVMGRNRRVGCSMTGIAQFVTSRGLEALREWSDSGYKRIQQVDAKLSEEFNVPRSIKTTSIKPSGTVSLLAGATPGMHYPESRFYLRRVRIPKDNPLIVPLERAGYDIEPAVDQPDSTLVVAIPVDAGPGVRTTSEVSMWEQLSLAAFLQRHWADNQVSCTVTFDPETEGPSLHHALDYFQYHLKGVSFLPKLEAGAYPQMPYEGISETEYKAAVARIKAPLDFGAQSADPMAPEQPPDLFCDAAVCELPVEAQQSKGTSGRSGGLYARKEGSD